MHLLTLSGSCYLPWIYSVGVFFAVDRPNVSKFTWHLHPSARNRFFVSASKIRLLRCKCNYGIICILCRYRWLQYPQCGIPLVCATHVSISIALYANTIVVYCIYVWCAHCVSYDVDSDSSRHVPESKKYIIRYQLNDDDDDDDDSVGLRSRVCLFRARLLPLLLLILFARIHLCMCLCFYDARSFNYARKFVRKSV